MVKQAVSIKVGCKTYNVSNSWNSLFLCGKEALRKLNAFSVYEQLRAEKYKDKAEVMLLSHAPTDYDDGIAMGLDTRIIEEHIKEMERRYELIASNEARNYIQYNQRNENNAIKLKVLIVEGADAVISDHRYTSFFESLKALVQKSRASGIHVISFINDLPMNNEDFFQYYGTPVHVAHKGFFMKDATNTIMKELYNLGLSPIINVSYDNEKETVWIGINVEVNDVHLSFSFNYDAHSVDYALLFPVEEDIDFNIKMEIYRTLRTDGSLCYDGFSESLYEGHLAITGNRWSSQITPLFVQCMVEEIDSLKVVKKLKSLQNPELFF